MTLLAPAFLFAAFAVAAAVVALHFIVTRQPRSSVLPTARFVPDVRATTVASARRPSDLLVMLLRVLLMLATGAALAKPVFHSSRRAQARVILVDVSRSARDSIAIRDSARRVYSEGDAVVLFDSSARVIAGGAADSLAALRATARRGNLSAALVAALRAGSSLRDRADSLELVIVSPFAREELDAATDSIRKLWPGRARLLTVRGTIPDTAAAPGKLQIVAAENDPLAVTVSLAQNSKRGQALINRSSSQPAPPAIASAEAVIDWPESARPIGAVQRSGVDTVGGVTSGDVRVVAAFERRWSYPADSLRGADVIARWVDGEAAAIERANGTGCVRSVAILVTPIGDLAIRTDFVRFVGSMSRPCAQQTSLLPADPQDISKLAGAGGLASRESFQAPRDTRSPLAPWLLALAIVAAIAEVLVRGRARRNAITTTSLSDAQKARAA